MTETFDCIVIGVGGFGSSALFDLARRGLRVLGIEQFGIAHDQGSSHGATRMIRKAYFEHPNYVPLLIESYAGWRDLESRAGCELMHLCGLMIAGTPGGTAVQGTRQSAREQQLPLEDVQLSDARRRFPGFRFRDDMQVVHEADAGYLEVERCVENYVGEARKLGAELLTGEAVTGWTSNGSTVSVTTSKRTYATASLVITSGAWSSRVLADLGLPLNIVRKPLFWHPVNSRAYDISNGQPAFFFELPDRDGRLREMYGFPCLDGRSLKVGEHTGGEAIDDPAAIDRTIHASDTAAVEEFLRECMPDVGTAHERHSVCMYTRTPDCHFIIDQHPLWPNVAFGAGFSGHGFKFASSLGRAIAELATEHATDLPIGFLSLDR
ncbi:MAG: N-methyl-L-tryptophan oxidase, partial [Planctomycetota bacterium]|nr:N-methyl-L-tryptophan oxidase [Planctomycetota bacterium]